MKNSMFPFVAKAFGVVLLLIVESCGDKDSTEPVPVITDIYPASGLIGSPVTIYGDRFVPAIPADQGVGPHPNTSIIAFNGTLAEAAYVYQDSIGKQRINTTVPVGASSGKITVTANGHTVSSTQEFVITQPTYLPNVEVSTIPGWGLDVAIDSEGNLFLTNKEPYEIVKITPDGKTQTLWSSSGSDFPFGIAVDAKGNVYASMVNSYILKIDTDGKATTLAGSTDGGDVDGPAASARFRLPLGIDVDKDGNVYVADTYNHKIRKITPDGIVSTLAGGTPGYKDSTGPDAQFQGPRNVTVDTEGTVYVADGSRIRMVSSSGQVTTIAGSEVAGYRDGTKENAQFNSVNGIAKDAAGNLYVADENNFVIRRIAPNGTVVTVAGSTFGHKDGPGSSALFTQTQGMAINASGHIFLTQGGGAAHVRKVTIN